MDVFAHGNWSNKYNKESLNNNIKEFFENLVKYI